MQRAKTPRATVIPRTDWKSQIRGLEAQGRTGRSKAKVLLCAIHKLNAAYAGRCRRGEQTGPLSSPASPGNLPEHLPNPEQSHSLPFPVLLAYRFVRDPLTKPPLLSHEQATEPQELCFMAVPHPTSPHVSCTSPRLLGSVGNHSHRSSHSRSTIYALVLCRVPHAQYLITSL